MSLEWEATVSKVITEQWLEIQSTMITFQVGQVQEVHVVLKVTKRLEVLELTLVVQLVNQVTAAGSLDLSQALAWSQGLAKFSIVHLQTLMVQYATVQTICTICSMR